MSDALRVKGWLVPAYKMPPALDDVDVLRIVVRNGFSRDLAGLLIEDLRRVDDRLRDTHIGRRSTDVGFHH